MSISTALSNALSGLTASARSANVISNNLANVLTEGYGVRTLEVAARDSGQGVRVVGVARHVDSGILADRRLADSGFAYASLRSDYAKGLEAALGLPGQAGSLSDVLAEFEAQLTTAASKPEEEGRLQGAVYAAGQVTGKLNAVSGYIQDQRTTADAEIAQAVETINATLQQIEKINTQIAQSYARNNPYSALEDQRQAAIDQLADYIPVKQVPRDNGAVAVFTTGGAILLDGPAGAFEFTQTNVIAPHMTLQNGLVSGVSFNGFDVATSGGHSPIKGGRLAALFELRDDLAVTSQAQVDAIAHDMVMRYQQPGLDPSLVLGDAGLFTDGGAAYDPVDLTGLAGRIGLNARVDPNTGGAVWRLRDGLGAATQGPPGNATLLTAFKSVLSDDFPPASGSASAISQSSLGHVSSLLSVTGQTRTTFERELSVSAARQTELLTLEKSGGVDTDAETQRLLLVEQAYMANARMIETIDDMMQALLRI